MAVLNRLDTTGTGRGGKVRFGLFEADLQTGELRKGGVRIKIQGQPFKVLGMLLERAGEVVTREELQTRLWGDGTTVDFDHSLGTAVNKIREALGDSADNPRFVETLARRGYRFIAPAHWSVEDDLRGASKADTGLGNHGLTGHLNPGGEALRAAVAEPERSPAARVQEAVAFPFTGRSGAGWGRARLLWVAWGLGALVLALAIYIGVGARGGRRAPARIHQVTFSGHLSPGAPELESLPATATDGTRIYLPLIEDGRTTLSEVSIADGQTTPLHLPVEIAGPALGDISADGSRLLLRNHLAPDAEQSLWIVTTLGGDPRRIPNILAHDASWMPQGKGLIFSAGNGLYTGNEDGTGVQKLADLGGRAFWLRWSPDGSKLRFTLLNPLLHTTSLWEIGANGKGLRELLKGWNSPAAECCGSWTADGKYFVFQSTRDGSSNIWGLNEQSHLLTRNTTPFEITNGPLNYQAPIAGRSGHQIFFIGLDTRFDLRRYDSGSREFVPFAHGFGAMGRTEFSRDGTWVAWINPADGSLWRSRADGSDRLQLTSVPTQVFMMHWSPDNRQLAVMSRTPGQPWKLHLMGAGGGSSQLLLDEDRNEADPDFSPDGRQLTFGRLPDLMAKESSTKAIYIVDLQTHRAVQVPGSENMISPRWDPHGRYLAATSLNQNEIDLFDFATNKWRPLIARSVADPAWSHDGSSIYFHAFMEDGAPIYSVSVATGKLTLVAGLRNLPTADVVDYNFSGLAPTDVPIVRARTWTANLYTLNLDER